MPARPPVLLPSKQSLPAHPLRSPARSPTLCAPPPPAHPRQGSTGQEADHREFSITTTSWKTSYLSRQLQSTPDNCYRKQAEFPPPSPPSPACETLPPVQAGCIPGCQQLFLSQISADELACTGVEPGLRNKLNTKVVQWRRQGTAALPGRGGPNSKKLVSNLLWFASIS